MSDMNLGGASGSRVNISYESLDEATEVLALAFIDDPFLRYLFSERGYFRNLLRLFRFLCEARLELGWPLIGMANDARITGVACVSAPEKKDWPLSLIERFKNLKSDIGAEATLKLERFSALSRKYAPVQSHYYLAAIGIHPEAQGKGSGRALLEAVHQMSETHTESSGVYLDTGKQANVSFYEYFGYRLVARDKVDGVVDFWYMFRPNRTRE